jgi:hypothetical protein
VRPKIFSPTCYMGIPRGRFNERRRGEGRLPGAWAGPEVDSVSKNVLREFGAIDKSPPKCRQTRDPKTKTRGQIPKRLIIGIKPHLVGHKHIFAANSPYLARIYCHLSMPLLSWP